MSEHIETSIQAARDENPSGFNDGIGAALMNKLGTAIEVRKVELASTMMQTPDADAVDQDEGARDGNSDA